MSLAFDRTLAFVAGIALALVAFLWSPISHSDKLALQMAIMIFSVGSAVPLGWFWDDMGWIHWLPVIALGALITWPLFIPSRR